MKFPSLPAALAWYYAERERGAPAAPMTPRASGGVEKFTHVDRLALLGDISRALDCVTEIDRAILFFSIRHRASDAAIGKLLRREKGRGWGERKVRRWRAEAEDDVREVLEARGVVL